MKHDLPKPFPCHHDWEEVWSSEDNYYHCINCGKKIYDDPETLKKIAEHYRTEDAQLHEMLAQAWQDGHDTALINGQSINPHEGEPQ